MPGLIDCHVHVIHSEVNIRFMEAMPLTLLTARAATRLRAMLDRGFTTVRDTGGCDWGIKTGVEQGHLVGPRLFIAGQSIGPTGGHSDGRRRTDVDSGCACCNGLAFKSAVADGIDEVRKAAREQMRQGADHVKIMMSGGVASPYDPLDSLQFSEGEVRAAVEEAHAFGRYVCAHAYSAEAITRAARLGVRTIEHGNLIDDAAAKLMAEKGMFLVANLVTYYAMKERAAKFGMTRGEPGEERHRAGGRPEVAGDLQAPRRAGGLRQRPPGRAALGPEPRIHAAARGGGADRDHPLGNDHRGADPALGRQGRHAAPGAFADLLVVDGDPLQDLALLEDQGKHLSVIMKAGKFPQTPAELAMSSRASCPDPPHRLLRRRGWLDTGDKPRYDIGV